MSISYAVALPMGRSKPIFKSNCFPSFMEERRGRENIRFHYNTVRSAAEDVSLAYCYLEFSLSKFLVGGEFSSWFDSAVKKRPS